MSPSQLREVFHVEHKDLVPNYELVKLEHQLTNHHIINKRSINSDNLLSNKVSVSATTNIDDNKSKIVSKNNHHVKKDLSKIPIDISTNSVYEATDAESNKSSRFNDYNLKSIREHNVSFNAFGEELNLTLRPTQGLFRDGPNSLKMWHVRPDANASQGLFYEKVQEVSFCIYLLFFGSISRIAH